MEQKKVRGRFAPSPSGYMHIGNAMSALITWLAVRCEGGELILRMEDLDTQRCRDPKYIRGLIEDLSWLGLDWDEGGDGEILQSRRTEYYESVLEILRKTGRVYPCFCSKRDLRSAANAPHEGETYIYPGTCRSLSNKDIRRKGRERTPNMRLWVPDETVTFTDRICGAVSQNLAQQCGDFVLKRGGDGQFSYQLAVVADDIAMGVTQIVRGHDLLSSVPRQMYLYKLLGKSVPVYAHVPLVTDESGRRLSKRDRDLTIASLRERGITSEEIVGKLAFWSGLIPKEEPVKPVELIREFSFEKIHGETCPIQTNAFFAK